MTFYRLIALPIQMIRPANPDIRTLGGVPPPPPYPPPQVSPMPPAIQKQQ
jgi:hypothetical protein